APSSGCTAGFPEENCPYFEIKSVITLTASRAVLALSSPRRTSSIPIIPNSTSFPCLIDSDFSAISFVNIASLPIATPKLLIPCLYLQHQYGEDPKCSYVSSNWSIVTFPNINFSFLSYVFLG